MLARDFGRPICLVAGMICAIQFFGGASVALADRGAPPIFDTTDLFEAGQQGYTTFRIPALIITHKGTILLVCGGRYGGWGDWSEIHTMLRRSTNGGKTWEPARVLTQDGKNTVDNG